MVIDFLEVIYTANEGDDFVEVCVGVAPRGSLQRPVQLTVSTEDGTATGL